MKKRNYVLDGKTYKIPISSDEKIYVTINGFPENSHKPFEIFLNSHSTSHAAELNALTLTLSALARRDDIEFIIEDFKKIGSDRGVWWNPGKSKGIFVKSIPHAIALALEMYLSDTELKQEGENIIEHAEEEASEMPQGAICPKCGQPTLIKRSGCEICENPDCTFVGSCG
jgi:ribonucleoside-diphosphate reductase alpha chain